MIRPDSKVGILRWGSFELEPASGELRNRGSLIKLQPQHVQLLALLVEQAGKVVTREEIRQSIWGNQTIVDFDRSINFGINQIRTALHDNPQTPRYIETVPRKGYRFIAPIIESDSGSAEQAAPGENNGRSNLFRGRHWQLATLGAVALSLVLLTKIVAPWPFDSKRIESISVLPLENLSHDPAQDYFADGMTDELITTLAKISALRVTSRTSVMQYKETKKSVAQIARELSVDAVLEGSVLREQDRVRITVQLIRAAPERHLWAESYEAPLVGILRLQSDVARAVAQAIRIKVTEQERTRLTATRDVSPSAYDAFLKGRHLWEFKGEENLVKSREFLERSIAEDPGYALAWAALADTYNYLSSWGVLPRKDTAPRAREAAEKALELDNSLVTPLVALADVKTQYEWDWAGAERLFRQAIESSPNYGDAHHTYATYLAGIGRTAEALPEARKAYEVEPLNLEYAVNVPWKLYALHRYGDAESELYRLKDWWPAFTGTYVLASIYLQTGRPREAVLLAEQSVENSHRAVIELMFLGRILGLSGARSEGKKILDEMQQLSQRRYVPPEYIAIVYEGLGERDRAIDWFEKAYTEHSINVWFLPDPSLESIRADPRFKKIMQRMGLPQ